MTPLTFHLIPHVHWDREWYLSRAGFLARLVPMVDGVLDQLERHPDLRFHLDGQAILVEDYLSVRPDALSRIRALATSKRLAIGPWYILADELTPSGVGLRRNLAMGLELSRSLGGAAPVLYSPDAFGHPRMLPDLAAEQGIDWGVVWRGLGLVEGAERDLYRWRGGDGGSILLYHFPSEGYEVGAHLPYLGAELESQWATLRERFVARATGPEIAVPIGADHHALAPDLPRLAERLGELEPEANVRFSSFEEFFGAVESRSALPIEIAGELRDSAGYAWSLQGTFASRARLKRRYSRAELFTSEILDRIVLEGGSGSKPLLDQVWRTLVQCQFHDTICGCCSDEVAREQAVRLAAIEDMGRELFRESLARITEYDPNLAIETGRSDGEVLALWNPNDEPYSGVVFAETTWFREDIPVGPPGERSPRVGPGFREFSLEAPDGAKIPVQVLRKEIGTERIDSSRHYPDLDRVDRVWVAFEVGGLPAGASVYSAGGPRPFAGRSGLEGRGRILENRAIRLTSRPDGLFDLRDRRSDDNYPGLLEIVAEADRGDCYTPDIDPERRTVAAVVGSPLVSRGPLVATVRQRWRLPGPVGGSITGQTTIAVLSGDPTIRVRLELDNQARDQRVRIAIPVGVAIDGYRAGVGDGAMARTFQTRSQEWREERRLSTQPAQRYVAVEAGGRGLVVGAPGHFECEVTEAGDIWITLLRSVGALSKNDLATRRGHAGWETPTPLAQEPGRHVVDFLVSTELDADRVWRSVYLSPITEWRRDRTGRA